MDHFQLHKEGGVARVLIDRAEQRNAFNIRMWEGLAEIMESLSADRLIKVVIISGAGNTFASGADISGLKDLVDGEIHFHYLAAVEKAIESIVSCRQPVIAMVNGWAIGAGCELAVACDLRVCAEEAKFSVPAARLGIALNYGLINRLINLVGVSAAKELLLLGQPFTAERAYNTGLVNRVVPMEMLEEATLAMAGTISGNAPLAVEGMKAAVNRLSGRDEHPDHDELTRIERITFESEDFIEGATAFMEKRKPVWKGR